MFGESYFGIKKIVEFLKRLKLIQPLLFTYFKPSVGLLVLLFFEICYFQPSLGGWNAFTPEVSLDSRVPRQQNDTLVIK